MDKQGFCRKWENDQVQAVVAIHAHLAREPMDLLIDGYILQLLSALLEYLNLDRPELYNLLIFLHVVKASLSYQNASIISDSYTYLLCLKINILA